MRILALVVSSAAASGSSEMQIACHADLTLNVLQRLGKQCDFAAYQLKAYADNGDFDLDGQDCELLNYETHSTVEIHDFFTAKDIDSFCQDLDRGRGNRRRQRQREEEEEDENPLDIIQNYGCYCSFADNLTFGKGPAKNSLDELCRNSFWNYSCMRETDPSCINLSIYYVATVRKDDWEIEADCDLFNQALQQIHGWDNQQLECARSRCRIDSEFFLDVMAIALTNGYAFEEEYRWDSAGGTFDKEVGCSTNGGKQLNPESECCGSYPYRGPFNLAMWQCCRTNGNTNGSPYRPTFSTCCSDGTVANIGTTC